MGTLDVFPPQPVPVGVESTRCSVSIWQHLRSTWCSQRLFFLHVTSNHSKGLSETSLHRIESKSHAKPTPAALVEGITPLSMLLPTSVHPTQSTGNMRSCATRSGGTTPVLILLPHNSTISWDPEVPRPEISEQELSTEQETKLYKRPRLSPFLILPAAG